MSTAPKHHNAAFLALVNDAKTRVRELNIDEYKQLQASGEPHILVDVREDNEWNSGHVQGARHLSKGIIERDIETVVPEKETKLVLYCGGGFRSALAGDALRQMGYANVYSLDGGWRALQASGVPLEK